VFLAFFSDGPAAGTVASAPQPPVTRYEATAALVVLCFLVLVRLHGRGGVLAFYTLFPAILLLRCCLIARAGMFAAVLSVDRFTYTRASGSRLNSSLVVYMLIAILILFSEALRAGWERAVAAEQAKDLLLRELRHRTKNNLAILELQAGQDKSGNADGTREGCRAGSRVEMRIKIGANFHA
jgi:hypothetical protein